MTDVASLTGFINEALDINIKNEEVENDINDRKKKKSQRRKERRMSNLETIQEVPEMEKEVESFSSDNIEIVYEQISNEHTEGIVVSKKKLKKKRKEKLLKNNVDSVKDDEDPENSYTDKKKRKKKDRIKMQKENELQIVNIHENEERVHHDLSETHKIKIRKCLENGPESSNENEHENKEVSTDEVKKTRRDKHRVHVDRENGLQDVNDDKNEGKALRNDDQPQKKRKHKKKISNKYSEEKNLNTFNGNECNITITQTIETTSEKYMQNQQNVQEIHMTEKVALKDIEQTPSENDITPVSSFNQKKKFNTQNSAIVHQRMSKRILKTLFQENAILSFPGSNVDSIGGYGSTMKQEKDTSNDKQR